MALRYYYNSETCKYEPSVVSPSKFVKKVFNFIGISLFIGICGLGYYNYMYPLVDEVNLRKENKKLKAEWQVIHSELKKTSDHLAEIEKNDDSNYRVILSMDPLSASQREAGVGGHEKASAEIDIPLIGSAMDFASKIESRLNVETQSMSELKDQWAENQKQWSARPAIQPISNKELIHLYLAFGERFLPQDGYSRQHNGLDFVAPYGSPIYATGDGVVSYASGGTTYGNVVFVNHGYSFETRYAHMSKFIVTVGQLVKRGQVLGYVGNTGHSFGNHLHYEVRYQNNFVNPINFFQRDLNNKEYEKLISHAIDSPISLD
ncbi:MAG: M23 family metallopeptidase [Bacteroidetes bacterium]|nr:M23 family metallopeptidase [Bacteroidota bacterium]